MDYDLEALHPSSHRSRMLSWLAASSGVALILIALGSGEARSASGGETVPSTSTVSSTSSAVTAPSDALTTSSITPTLAPIRAAAADRSLAQHANLPASERHVLILLLFGCFAVMATGAYSLWRRGWQSFIGSATTDRRK